MTKKPVGILAGALGGLCLVMLAVALYPPALERAYSFIRQDNIPHAPVEIARGVFYVGASDIASYLIDTGAGLIVIDAGYEDTVPQIVANIRALGYDPHDVKILLNTHAHFDHASGLAALQRATGGQLYASAPEATLLRSGGRGDFFLQDFFSYPPPDVARELDDGEVVRLGNAELTARLTPGHTRGCTSWSFPVELDDGRDAQAVIICSLSTLSYSLAPPHEAYPGIADDYRRSFDSLEALPCDVFLGSHAHWFDFEGKSARAARGDRDAFFDPTGCGEFLRESRIAFEQRLRAAR